MALRDLQEFLEDDGLEYPLRASSFEDPTKWQDREHDDGTYAKKYRVPSPSARTGLWLTSLWDLGAKAASGGDISAEEVAAIKLDDDQEKTLYQRVLGPVYDEMLADGVKWTALQRVGQDAYLCFAASKELANQALTSLGKAPTNRAQRRAAKRTAGRKSAQASTATETRTRRRASTG